jgi:hypothetical protein
VARAALLGRLRWSGSPASSPGASAR